MLQVAGIRIMTIKGDNKLTEAIAVSDVGFDTHLSFMGTDFFKMSDAKQIKVLRNSNNGLVFSRMVPKHKQQLVKLLKSQGYVMAVTGDSLNDAPSLKQADIGIAMGLMGTKVAKRRQT